MPSLPRTPLRLPQEEGVRGLLSSRPPRALRTPKISEVVLPDCWPMREAAARLPTNPVALHAVRPGRPAASPWCASTKTWIFFHAAPRRLCRPQPQLRTRRPRATRQLCLDRCCTRMRGGAGLRRRSAPVSGPPMTRRQPSMQVAACLNLRLGKHTRAALQIRHRTREIASLRAARTS